MESLFLLRKIDGDADNESKDVYTEKWNVYGGVMKHENRK